MFHRCDSSGGLDYFNDGSQFATAGKDRLLRVYDEATKRQVMTLQGGDMKVRDENGVVKTGGSGDLHEHEGTVFVRYVL